MLIQGSLVALVTPMTPEGAVDWDAYERLIEWHIASGTDGIVTMGTTGESPTLDIAEHNEVVAFTVKKVAGRVPVIAGTGGNSTAEAIELTQHARDVGADVSLQVVPYYNKPTQEGLYQHFKAIAEAVNMPMWLYNVPGRTVADLKNDTVLRLAQIPNIVGLKDATGDIARAIDLLRRLPEVVGDKEFAVYSGNDDQTLPMGHQFAFGDGGHPLEIFQVGSGDQLVEIFQPHLVPGQNDDVLGETVGLAAQRPQLFHLLIDGLEGVDPPLMEHFPERDQHVAHRGGIVAGPVVIEGGQVQMVRHNVQLVLAETWQQVLG